MGVRCLMGGAGIVDDGRIDDLELDRRIVTS